MADRTPAEQLRDAAETLLETARGANPDRWVWTPGDGPAAAGDTAWINLMHPGLGLLLSEWLKAAAVDAEEIGPGRRAVAFACAIQAAAGKASTPGSGS